MVHIFCIMAQPYSDVMVIESVKMILVYLKTEMALYISSVIFCWTSFSFDYSTHSPWQCLCKLMRCPNYRHYRLEFYLYQLLG